MPIPVEICVRWKEQLASTIAREAIHEIKIVRAPKAYDPTKPADRVDLTAAYAQGWADALDALVALGDERPKQSDTPFRDMTSRT